MTPQHIEFLWAHRKYSNDLLRYCTFKINNHEAANDLLQETFMRAWRYMNKGNSIDNMKAFLFKIMSNLIVSEYRKRSKSTDSLERLQEEGFEPGFDDTDRWIDSIDGSHAVGLIKTMSKTYQETLSMRYLKGFSIREIAQATSASENTIAVRIHRGLRILNKSLSV